MMKWLLENDYTMILEFTYAKKIMQKMDQMFEK